MNTGNVNSGEHNVQENWYTSVCRWRTNGQSDCAVLRDDLDHIGCKAEIGSVPKLTPEERRNAT